MEHFISAQLKLYRMSSDYSFFLSVSSSYQLVGEKKKIKNSCLSVLSPWAGIRVRHM